jgi:hypothetical protein
MLLIQNHFSSEIHLGKIVVLAEVFSARYFSTGVNSCEFITTILTRNVVQKKKKSQLIKTTSSSENLPL